MEVVEKKQDNVYICELSGRLDANTSPAFEEKVMSIVGNGEKYLIMDFDSLEYISSAGLRVLLKTVKELKRSQGKMVLCSVKDYIKEVFEMAGFATFIPMAANQEEALRQF